MNKGSHHLNALNINPHPFEGYDGTRLKNGQVKENPTTIEADRSRIAVQR
jgi:hypothetical protein